MRSSIVAALLIVFAAGSQSAFGSVTDPKAAAQERKHVREHARALDRAFAGDTRGALRLLGSLTTGGVQADELDRVYLSIGRIQYQTGKFSEAIEAYGKVRPGSSSWLEALEERATALMRLGRTEDALASLKTVLTPLFEERIPSEPFFLTAFAQMRVCDYKSVFKTLDLFKARYREKVKEWEKVGASDKVAQKRLKELKGTLEKLNLVEAETIQHLYVGEAGKPHDGSPPPIVKAADQLTFPTNHEIDAKEIWLDEVDAFRVTAKACPTRTEAIPVALKE